MKNVRNIGAALALVLSSSAWGQGNQAPWALDSTTSPHPLNLYVDGGWKTFGKVSVNGSNLDLTWPGNSTTSGNATINGLLTAAGGDILLGEQHLSLTPNSTGAATANTTALNAAIQNAATNKVGTISLPCGTFYVNGTILNNVQGVLIKGCAPLGVQPTGSGFSPSPSQSTWLVAFGATFSPLFQHSTPSSTTTPIFSGGGIVDVVLDGNALVNIPLYVKDVQKAKWRAYIKGAASVGAKFEAGTNNVDCKGTCLVQFSEADLDIDTRGTAAYGVELTGTAASNVAFNKMRFRTLMGTGIGLNCINADNNNISYAAQVTNGGQDVVARGRTASQSPGCSFNTFDYISGFTVAANAIYAEGTSTAGVLTPATNSITRLDLSNLTPTPTYGTGAQWDYYDEYELHQTNLSLVYKFALPSRTIATLPTCNGTTDGWTFEVPDQTGASWDQGLLTGGGTLRTTAFCDGVAGTWKPQWPSANHIAAWQAYTPTLSCGAGTLTTASATGSYVRMGKTVTFQVTAAITTVGTCATTLSATLPVQAGATTAVVAGKEVGGNNFGLVGLIGATATTVVATAAHLGTFTALNGDQVVISGSYQSQ